MRNTTADSTALGMYDSGTVRKSSTTTTITPVVNWAIWLGRRPVDHFRLGRAAVDDERAGEARGQVAEPQPDEVHVLVEAVVYFIA